MAELTRLDYLDSEDRTARLSLVLAANLRRDARLETALTSNTKDLKLFWNVQCTALASHLWLPTETDWLASVLTIVLPLSLSLH
jgi:hypothetical protein